MVKLVIDTQMVLCLAALFGQGTARRLEYSVDDKIRQYCMSQLYDIMGSMTSDDLGYFRKIATSAEIVNSDW